MPLPESGFEYTIEDGDSIAGIARKFNIPNWKTIYHHDRNAGFRKSNPVYRQITVGDRIFIPYVSAVTLKTGRTYRIIIQENELFVDTHMHIQSNNCTPLPLQWALIRRLVPFRPAAAREPLGVFAGALPNRFGKIGNYDSDEIARIYFGTGRKSKNVGTPFRDCKVMDITKNAAEWVAGNARALLTKERGAEYLAQISENRETEFENATLYYYGNNNIKQIAASYLMDLSYSHFWGNCGLPVNLPAGSSQVFINDFITGGVTINMYGDTCRAKYTSMTERPVLGMEMPGWAHLFPRHLPDDTFSFRTQYKRFSEMRHKTPTGKTEPTVDSFIRFSEEPELRNLDSRLLQKDYIHIVEDLPKSESKRFEDYEQQRLRSIKAAMTYPLRLLPFYHFDPRRHIPQSQRTRLLEDLEIKHAFYRLSSEQSYLKMTPDRVMNSRSWRSDTLAMLCDMNSFREQMFFDPISTKGVFWGVKMYPRLGYAPDDFVQFPQLKNFYTICAENNIPIAAHCSRGPMCIADYVNYSRYGSKTGNPPPARAEDPIDYKRHEFWFADTFTSAANWERILNEKQFSDLKTNLAHFGGMDLWLQIGGHKGFSGEFRDIEKYFPTDPGKLPQTDELDGNDEEKEAQLASLYYAWIRKTAKLCQQKNNVYTDLACFALPDRTEKGENGAPQMELVAKNLAFLITRYPKLKERILMGSDWFMPESEGVKGVGPYLKNMFEMLRMVSGFVEPGFDAWHQFAVINPLKFMNLWVDGGNIDTDLCGRYVERLAGWADDEEIKRVCISLPSMDDILKLGKLFTKYLYNIAPIKHSNHLKDKNGKLFILDF